MNRKVRLIFEALKHKFLNLDVSLIQVLICPLFGVLGKILPQSLFNVARQRLLALDQVGIIAIHLTYQSGRTVSDDHVWNLSGESTCFTNNVASELGQGILPG